jgi:16S rRNA (guanine527-N7)-methyltransferase
VPDVIILNMEKLVLNARRLFGIHLTGRQLESLTAFENELLKWNEKYNLTAIRDREAIRTKHFLDSFSCSLAWKDQPPRRLIDIGTGAGFPGIPLKIIYPKMEITLVESVRKKAEFCRHAIEALKLTTIQVIVDRAELAGQMPSLRESFDWAVARAVAQLPVLAEYMLPFIKVGGKMLAQKGSSAPGEVHLSANAFMLLGGQMHQLMPVILPGVVDERFLVVVDKVAATPPQYPRKPGLPTKRPL